MNDTLPQLRLHNQKLIGAGFDRPVDAVRWFGALQAQDYASVIWAMSLRSSSIQKSAIESAILERSIVRTWLLRGTLHVVAAADLGWLLNLLGPRQIQASRRRYLQLELDEATFSACFKVIGQALDEADQLTRDNLCRLLEKSGIAAAGARGYHILRRTALEGLICFGPPAGKQETFILTDWLQPAIESYDHEAALTALAIRYFRAHGPATLGDFIWWSGLKVKDARTGIALASSKLKQVVVEDEAYWFSETSAGPPDSSPSALLLPAYDEYYLGYKRRDMILNSTYDKRAVSNNGVFRPTIVSDGQVVGTWKHKLTRRQVQIALNLFRPLLAEEKQRLALSVSQFGAHLDLDISLVTEV